MNNNFKSNAEISNCQTSSVEKTQSHQNSIEGDSLNKFNIDVFDIHPEVLKTYQDKDLRFLKISMEKNGQLNPITAVRRGDRLLVVDGVSRDIIAKEIGISELLCNVIDISDDDILNHRIKINLKTKTSIIEKCYQGEHILGILGDSQGKKREILGFSNEESDEEFGSVGKDRFELTCEMLGFEFGASTLRKLMYVFWKQLDGKDLGVLKLIDEGKISINEGFNKLKVTEKKVAHAKELIQKDFEGKCIKGWYKLNNKSSLDLSDILDESVELSVQSPPYAGGQRDYPNQDEFCHGQENTVEEYVENELKFYREVRKKLKPDGVLAIILGESYEQGYKGVCTKLETALENDGWKILDVIIWAKSNPNPRPHENYFLPAYERIIVCTKNDAKPTFNDYKITTSDDNFKLKRSKNKKDGSPRFYVGNDDKSLMNVIITPVFQKTEFRHIDPTFRHDAPAPTEIYKRLIDAYSNPSDTFLDIFCGSGQGLDYALSNGRNAIGYDVDPLSINFCEKRLQMTLDAKESTNLSLAA